VLPPARPKVLLRVIHSEDPFTCTAISSGNEWVLETGRKIRISIGEATAQRLVQDTRAARPSAAYALSLVVGKTRTLVKVRRGATIVANGTNAKRAVVLGRQQQVLVPTGRDPRQPTKITLSRQERQTFAQLERSLPPVTDKTPPAIRIDGPSTPSSVRYAAFAVTATEAASTFSCALDGTDFRLCTTPYRVEGLEPGRHTFAVRVTDATGNTRTRTFSWIVDNSRIAFVSEQDGNREIYVMEPDGTSQVRLTTRPGADDAPDWSPDRTRIAFHSDRDGNVDIYVMNADGSNQTRITTDSAVDRNPSWSPNGRMLAFESFREGGNRDIYVMNADGSGTKRLTIDPGQDFDPAWSPDGRRVVFASDRSNGNYDIYVMSADGSGQTRLTDDPAVEFNPSWSPDGRLIAFHSFRGPPAQYQNLYAMNPDGSGVVRITRTQRNDWNPAWAPDGRHLVFQSDRVVASGVQVYIVDVGTGEERRLTTGPGDNLVPDW
jgi:TolB protein